MTPPEGTAGRPTTRQQAGPGPPSAACARWQTRRRATRTGRSPRTNRKGTEVQPRPEVLKPDPQRELHFHTASALPNDRGVVYVVHRAGQGTGSNTLGLWSDGQARVLIEVAGQALDNPVYSSSGHVLFQRSPANAGVWGALPFSLNTLEATGEPFLVSQGTRGPSVASDGTLVLLPPRRQRPINLAWTDRNGTILGRIDEPRFRQTAAAISPDGHRIRRGNQRGNLGHLAVRPLCRPTESAS